jgi:hypothetical protein
VSERARLREAERELRELKQKVALREFEDFGTGRTWASRTPLRYARCPSRSPTHSAITRSHIRRRERLGGIFHEYTNAATCTDGTFGKGNLMPGLAVGAPGQPGAYASRTTGGRLRQQRG